MGGEMTSLTPWCVGLALLYVGVGVYHRRRVLRKAREWIDRILEWECSP